MKMHVASTHGLLDIKKSENWRALHQKSENWKAWSERVRYAFESHTKRVRVERSAIYFNLPHMYCDILLVLKSP